MSIPTKSLEFLLESWRDHSKTGFHVTFLVSPEDQEFFKACPQGQRFTAVLVKLTDEDKPAPLPTPADLKREEKARAARGVAEAKAHGITVKELEAQQPLPISNVVDMPEPKEHHGKFPPGLCGLAVKWCADDHFQLWLADNFADSWSRHEKAAGPDGSDEEVAKNVVCYLCAITSRKELDTSDTAAATFKIDIMAPYAEARRADGIDAPTDAPF